MSFFEGCRLIMAPVLMLIPPDESPTRRRACMIVGRELRKIADDLEASYEVAKLGTVKPQKRALFTVCCLVGVVFVGRAIWKNISN